MIMYNYIAAKLFIILQLQHNDQVFTHLIKSFTLYSKAYHNSYVGYSALLV